jgi:hypothetical protein
MKKFETTNLLLAALLISANGDLDDLKVGPRFSKAELDLSSLDAEGLALKLERLAVGVRQEDPDWTLLFDKSVLGDIEDKYLRLKRMISRARK